MQLDRVAVALRPRTHAEACDLGVRMARAWLRPAFGAWFPAFLPVLLVATLALRKYPWAGLILIWWLKPLYDAILLQVFSRALFGERPTAGDTLRGIPRLWRTVGVRALTLWRIDPLRAILMPVSQLEGQRGHAAFARRALLAKTLGVEAGRLVLVFALFEVSLASAVPLFLGMFFPDAGVSEWFSLAGSRAGTAAQLWLVLYAAAICLLEPFFVACAFSLYINRRTHLEAWDVEVAFRRMAARLSALAAAGARAGAVVLLFGSVLLAAGGPARAADENEDASAEKRIITRILADEEFGGSRTVRRWTFDLPEQEESESSFNLFFLGSAFATVLEPLMWMLAIGLLAAAVFFVLLRADIGMDGLLRPGRRRAPAIVAGLDVREESLPDDVAAEARALWDAGRHREALRLLYRAAIARMIHSEGVDIPPSATEGDVLRLSAAPLGAERFGYFSALTRAWTLVAYGHRAPDPADDEIVRSWTRNFEAGA